MRSRFAPSPTGLLHIGGLRTALYNYLLARKHDGDFVLRIEDTDRERFVEAAEADITDALRWTGLNPDEGPEQGGPHVPYRQSRRAELYAEAAQSLLADGRAYPAFDTVDELDLMRERLSTADNPTPKYDAETRVEMRNGLTLSGEEVERRIASGEPYVVRLKVEPGRAVTFDDHIRGRVSIDSSEIDDQVLVKSDGMPTYHLANVVDDHYMGISHVVRGEEWLPSTPKHILLYEYLGWEAPVMAHLPLILNPSGGKLSKRNADELGIPVSVREYREAGYEPEALINFLAFLGWNPGTEEEIFTLDELVDVFSLERVGSSGVQFNLDKLRWYNEQHLRRLGPDELVRRVRPAVQAEGFQASDAYLRQVVELMRERISMASDVAQEAPYFFDEPDSYDEKGVKKRWKADSPELLTEYADRIESADGFDADLCEQVLRSLAEEREKGAGRIIHPTRLAVSGVTFGPSLFHLMEVLGRDTCLRRMRRAVRSLG